MKILVLKEIGKDNYFIIEKGNRIVKFYIDLYLKYDFLNWLFDNDYNFEKYNINKIEEFFKRITPDYEIPVELFEGLKSTEYHPHLKWQHEHHDMEKIDLEELDEEIKEIYREALEVLEFED